MPKKVAIVHGVRSPFCRAGGVLRTLEPDVIGARCVRTLLEEVGIDKKEVDHLIFGNVMAPPHLANIARIISIKSGLGQSIPSFTVNRNCASGMEAIVSGMQRIISGDASCIVVGGVESMSQFPVLFPNGMREMLTTMSKAKGFKNELKAALKFRPRFLIPQIPKIEDPICGLSMGQTAEKLAREFVITRAEQDAFALRSQQRAELAEKQGLFAQESFTLFAPPQCTPITRDDGVRHGQTIKDFEKLRPAFDKAAGTVTAGNSSQMTDGAAALLLMSVKRAKELNITPLGYLTEHASVGLDPSIMGLGPVYATAKLLQKSSYSLSDFSLIEINEAFAAQVLSCLKAFQSTSFAKEHLNQAKALGEISEDIVNVNGGAISLGHPLGASGARITLTLLKELIRRKKSLGLATLCIGGGQGQAVSIEVNND